jgi:hypothetical protein
MKIRELKEESRSIVIEFEFFIHFTVFRKKQFVQKRNKMVKVPVE